MEDLRELNLVQKYLQYHDSLSWKEQRRKGMDCCSDAYNYPAGNCKSSSWNPDFLIVEGWNFIYHFNNWLEEKGYVPQLLEEAPTYGHRFPMRGVYEHGGRSPKRESFTYFLDYLTDDQWGFGDEYSCCDCCGNVVHTYDSVGPIREYWVFNCHGLICKECILQDEDIKIDYLSELIDNPNSCNLFLDLYSFGFEKFNDGSYEHGWYGTVQEPKDIYKRVKELYPNADVVFELDSCNPFATYYSVFYRENEEN